MLELPPFDIAAPTFDDFRRVLRESGIVILDDEPNLGFIGFQYGSLYCGFTRNGHHYVHVPLLYSDDTELSNRGAFDRDYRRLEQGVREVHGKPLLEGQYLYSHRPSSQHYYYALWKLRYCRLALLQNEYDIQFGLDISLRYLYAQGEAVSLLFEES